MSRAQDDACADREEACEPKRDEAEAARACRRPRRLGDGEKVKPRGALAEAGVRHSIACISPSTAGQIAAARIGLGVAPLPACVIAGERDVEPLQGLPPLPSCSIALLSPRRAGKALTTLRSTIVMAYGARR